MFSTCPPVRACPSETFFDRLAVDLYSSSMFYHVYFASYHLELELLLEN